MGPENVVANLTDLRRQVADWLSPRQRAFDEALDALGRGLGAVDVFNGPPLDYSESDTQAEFSFDVPGYAAEDLAVTVRDDVLTVTGRRASRGGASPGTYRVSERREGPFVRSAPLPSGADIEAIEATLKAGVLRIVVPRTPDGATRSIAIRIARPAAAR